MNLLRAISNLLRFDRTNWKALALCFLAAAVFWIFNALNKDYATNVRFPLLFEFDDTKFIPVEPLPPVIVLNVSGNGWELFRKSVGLKVPQIAIALERPVETRKIVASTLSPVVAGQIGPLQVNYIVSDTLRLKIEPRISRKIKLDADLKGVSYELGYGRISPVTVSPDSVTLEGPKSLLEQMSDTLTIAVHATRIDGNFQENIEVTLKDGMLIKRNPPVAEVRFDVGLIETQEFLLRLKTPRMPWGIETDHDSVRCVFLVPKKDHDLFLVDIEKVTAVLQLVELKKGESLKLMPEISNLPDYAGLVHVDSVVLKRY
ncbi:MAG TPA: hypothetical protein PLR06_10155 [Cyclobacteriaceae bacterium]|nr:hypothetical protein [Cyclobacteriaceae bacterium]